MPIAINGSGTVTGISVGGLPDGIVDTDMLAASSVTDAKTNLTGAIKAWADIYWNSGTPTARANGNVSSISDDGTGDMTISFSTAMPDTNYSCLVSGDDYGNSAYPGLNVGSTSRGKTTGGVSLVATQKDGTARDIAAVNFAVIR